MMHNSVMSPNHTKNSAASPEHMPRKNTAAITIAVILMVLLFIIFLRI